MGNKGLKPEPLILPRGVRFPRADEIPGDSTDAMRRISAARITTGYVAKRSEGELFDTYIEANVHAPQIFDVFRKLIFGLMPETAAPLIGIKDEDPIFGPYTDRSLAVGVFEPYVDLLQNDGFLEFGVVHQSKFAFEEIFVASPKYFRIWTNQSDVAKEILRSAGIPERETLEFIDEYPMTSLSLTEEGSAWAAPFYAIQDEFDRLPGAAPPSNNS